MDYDLLIRNGRVVDGSGMPGYQADVGVRTGKIVEIGRLKGSATRTIDASGLVVSPGFIDHHTHMDAQLFWDPWVTAVPFHGVTSIVMGNCGLSLAPVKSGEEEPLISSFARVEAVPRSVLDQGIPWGWHSYGDYLDALEGKIGVNIGGLVGHTAMRYYIMGEEAVEREATADEIARMRALLREQLEGGALGFSSDVVEHHNRLDGKPNAARLASWEERASLCDVLAELNTGLFMVSRPPHMTPEIIAQRGDLSERMGRPVVWLSLSYHRHEGDLWRDQLLALEASFKKGQRAYGIAPITGTQSLINFMSGTATFDEYPTWKHVMLLPHAAKKQAFADQATSEKLRAELAHPAGTFDPNWDAIRVFEVAKPENEVYVGKSVAEMAAGRGQDPVHAFMDLALEEDLETTYRNSAKRNLDVMGEILRSPYVVAGMSDAGAHVLNFATYGQSTALLGQWTRELGVFTLEQAVHKLTFRVASIWGLEGRGLLRPGYAADIAVFDSDTVEPCDVEWTHDLPGGQKRLTQRANGIGWTIVNGRVVCEDGRLTEEMPGEVLRGTGYVKRPTTQLGVQSAAR